MNSRLATDAEIKTWREDGWVLLEGLVGTDEIDALADDLHAIFPSGEELHADPEGVTERWQGHPKEPEEIFVWPDEGPGFRPAQQRFYPRHEDAWETGLVQCSSRWFSRWILSVPVMVRRSI